MRSGSVPGSSSKSVSSRARSSSSRSIGRTPRPDRVARSLSATPGSAARRLRRRRSGAPSPPRTVLLGGQRRHQLAQGSSRSRMTFALSHGRSPSRQSGCARRRTRAGRPARGVGPSQKGCRRSSKPNGLAIADAVDTQRSASVDPMTVASWCRLQVEASQSCRSGGRMPCARRAVPKASAFDVAAAASDADRPRVAGVRPVRVALLSRRSMVRPTGASPKGSGPSQTRSIPCRRRSTWPGAWASMENIRSASAKAYPARQQAPAESIRAAPGANWRRGTGRSSWSRC